MHVPSHGRGRRFNPYSAHHPINDLAAAVSAVAGSFQQNKASRDVDCAWNPFRVRSRLLPFRQPGARTMKISTTMTREIGRHRRSLRRHKRRADPATRERCRVGLKGLTVLEVHPLRPGLATSVAMAVRRAGA
jgi:hypothetical protein